MPEGREAFSRAVMPSERDSSRLLRVTLPGFLATVTVQVAVLPFAAVAVTEQVPSRTPVIAPVSASTQATFLLLVVQVTFGTTLPGDGAVARNPV